MSTLPTIPVEPAGVIATSADLNAWANACTFLLGSGSGSNPMFLLMASATQSWSTTAAFCNFSNTAALFKDNDGGWSSGNPGRYTVQTPGYWVVDYTINGGTSANNLKTWLQVTTTASNPFNPSATIDCMYGNTPATSATVCTISAGGLIPIYLYTGDLIQVSVTTGAASTSGTSPFSHMSGELVSA